MIEFQPFVEDDFDQLKSWITSEDILFQFAGPLFNYPLTNIQLMKYLQMSDKKPFKIILKSTHQNIGHCELNFEDGSHRLSRILIGEEGLRGQKIGEQVVRKMANLLFENKAVQEVDLWVFDWNKNAIKCYEKVGFKINLNNCYPLDINGKSWFRLNMILSRHEFLNA